MSNHLKVFSQSKIKAFREAVESIEKIRSQGLKIVQCHGVFDLLHPGHIRHFREAKSQGDCLVVTVTPDRFVNKGPGRPAFPELLRLEALASLSDIDFVILNDAPDAVPAIERIRPHFYVKGSEYRNHAGDVTGKIAEEAHAVAIYGGAIYYTDDIVFSSSSLLNRYFDTIPAPVSAFLSELKEQYSSEDVMKALDSLSSLKVLIVGDAILDEYQYVDPLGLTGKGLHMVARCKDKEVFLGGSLIIANHVAQFAGNVTLLTALGKDCPYLNFINQTLDPKVNCAFSYLDESRSLVKKRYVLRDGKTLTKLFETYSGQEEALSEAQTDQIIDYLKQESSKYDLVLVCDFGNGFTNPRLIDALSDLPAFLALNTQTNSGNRGFNMITNYRRADYISLNEPELRLAAHDKTSSLEGIAADISEILSCPTISITQGVDGVSCFSNKEPWLRIPALATNSVDRIGAGDSYLSLSSLCLAKGLPVMLAGFIGSAAAAMSIQVVGNQESVKKSALSKFLARLLK